MELYPLCARPDCGHVFGEHEFDFRFSHAAGACGFGMSADNPDGACECMSYLEPDMDDELPAVLAADNG